MKIKYKTLMIGFFFYENGILFLYIWCNMNYFHTLVVSINKNVLQIFPDILLCKIFYYACHISNSELEGQYIFSNNIFKTIINFIFYFYSIIR